MRVCDIRAVARIANLAVAIGANCAVIPICLCFGLLGIRGSLSDTSEWANWIMGAQFLVVGGIAIMNVVAILVLRKRMTQAMYGLNAMLLLIAVYLWAVKADLFGRIVPPVDSTIISLIAITSLVALTSRSCAKSSNSGSEDTIA